MFLRILFTLAALSGSAFAESPKVATDIPPVHGLVSRVMEGVGEPALVVPPSASVHSHDLRPSEAAALDQAEVVFWIGEELSPWLLRPVDTLASDAHVVTLLDLEGTVLLPFREAEGFDAHDDHGHADDHADEGDAHGHGAVDPHAWLDPANAGRWLEVIAETLAKVDPSNADAYRANAAAGQTEILAAAEASAARLSGAGEIRYLVFHDAYQYFEEHFGLAPVGAITLGDAAAPGPARIAAIQKQLRDTGADCLLIEPQESSALVGLFQDAGIARTVEIDPLGIRVPAGPDHYAALLASLSDSFAACR